MADSPLDHARIIDFDAFARIRDGLGRIVCTSGGFDPIHPGHLSCIVDSRRHGDCLAVIVNGDAFLRAKKGRPFMNLDTRCRIVSAVRNVDYVIPFEIEGDQTVRVALQRLRPHVFTKGGDRFDPHTIPEWEVCQRLNIEVVTGVGLDKSWSSSDFLGEWGEFYLSRTHRHPVREAVPT